MGQFASFKFFVFSICIALILAGGTLGAFYFISNNSSISLPKGTANVSPVTKPVTSEPVSLTLNLTSPENELLVFDSDLLVQGKTSPKSTVILSLDDEDLTLLANDSGDFSTTVKLNEGANKIIVAVFDNLGNEKKEERAVFYSTEKI